MFLRVRSAGLVVALGATAALAAPIQAPVTETITDRAAFIPHSKYQSLKGTAVGVVVGNVQAMMGQEGRSGPPDAIAFSVGGNSYRWMYVPVTDKPLIQNLRVRVGEDGKEQKNYPSLSMANPTTIKQWNIDVPVALVEVQVNDGMGAPADQGFVATQMRRIDGTKDFPAKLPDVVDDARKRYAQHVKEHQKTIDDALAEAQQKALKDTKPTGPRETKELFFITWLPEKERLRIAFRTTITDGAYQYGGGVNPGPFPLPVPPAKEGAPQEAIRRPPPPPRGIGVRFGTEFGVEYGAAFEITTSGKVDRILVLPAQTFSRVIPPPPVLRGPVDRLPPKPVEKKD